MKDQVHSGHHHHPNDHISPPQVHINQSSPGHYHPTVQQDEKILIWFNIEWCSPTLQWEDVRGHRARSKSCFYAPDCGMSLPSLLQHLVPSSFLFHALNPFQVVPASNPMQKITWHFWESGYFKRLVAVYNALVQQALIPMMRRVWIQNRNFKSFSKVCGYTFYIHTLIKCMVKGYKMESLASWAVTNQKMQSYNNWKIPAFCFWHSQISTVFVLLSQWHKNFFCGTSVKLSPLVQSFPLTLWCLLWVVFPLSVSWPMSYTTVTAFRVCLVSLTVQSSGIFSSEQLRPESLSIWSKSLKRSTMHWAVSRASGSWSQHSTMISHTCCTSWWLSQLLGISGLPRSLRTTSFMLSTQGCSRTLEPKAGS